MIMTETDVFPSPFLLGSREGRRPTPEDPAPEAFEVPSRAPCKWATLIKGRD